MADNLVKGFQTDTGTAYYDYSALANVPDAIKSEDNLNDFIEEKIANLGGGGGNNSGSSIIIDTTLSQKGQAADAQAVGQALKNKIESSELQTAVNEALEQAKEKGDFKGDPGDDYVLTNTDKEEIANIVLGQIEIPDSPGGGENVDLTGYATKDWVKQQNYITSIPSDYVTSGELTSEVNSALELAKQSGEFKGDKGDPFTYNDFTEEQIDALKGEKGEPFTYNDFTQEQINALKGEKGDPFTYDDFTPEQLAALKGEPGDTPQKGVDYNDGVSATHKWEGTILTVTSASGTSSANLKGEKGDSFTYNDFTEEQLKDLVGPQGDPGYSPYVDITTSQQTDGRNKVTITVVSKGEDGEMLTFSGEIMDGKDGKSGETPQRGVHYWTAEDQQAIINEVLAAIPVAETEEF